MSTVAAFPLGEPRSARLKRLAGWAAIGVGFAIPVSVAADGALTAAAVLLLLLSGGFREQLAIIARNPVALAALALLGWLALAVTWSQGDLPEAMRHLRKYADLALVALLLPLFREGGRRRAGLLALAAALALTLAVSYAVAAGAIPKTWLRVPDPTSAIAFKLRVTHSFLVAFAAFLFALLARESRGWPRAAWAALAALSAVDVTLLVEAQTGWLVLAALGVYLLTAGYGRRGLALAAILVTVAGAAGYLGSDGIRARVDETVAQFAAPGPAPPAAPTASAALRMEFYRNTASLIAGHPLVGVGTGGFPAAYAERAAASGLVATDNPHNEYLLMTAQTGVPGLVLLLILYGTAWRCGARLPTPLERDLARGLVVAMAVGSLFNSLLLDHTEGLLFAWMSALLFAGLKSRDP